MELHQILDEKCKSYTGNDFMTAWGKVEGGMMRKVIERSVEEFVKQSKGVEGKILEEVIKMREAQKEYFKHRNQTNLELAKKWERQIDRRIKEADENDNQLSIFP